MPAKDRARTFRQFALARLINALRQPDPQLPQLGFFAFQKAQTGAKRLRGVLVATFCNQMIDHARLRLGQHNVSGGYGVLSSKALAYYANSSPSVKKTLAETQPSTRGRSQCSWPLLRPQVRTGRRQRIGKSVQVAQQCGTSGKKLYHHAQRSRS